MRILTVVGARPQFVKAAALSRVLRASTAVEEMLVHTGQHYDADMSDVFFAELGIPAPDEYLGVGSGTHGVQTGRMLIALDEVLTRTRPDGVVVYGDTNSTLAGTLAAAKLHIPVAHVEAGLRSGDRRMPEEINRVLTDHASDLLFAPTDAAVGNLAREGIPAERVHHVGDVMYDVALLCAEHEGAGSRILERIGVRRGEYVLTTVHRAENTDDFQRLAAIVGGLSAVARSVPVVMPLHPRTRQALRRHGLEDALAPVVQIDPVGYLDMTALERNARLVVTDSGGVQKEAFFFRVPCVTLRGSTEWTELVDLGWNRLLPPTEATFVAERIQAALDVRPSEPSSDPYGGGRASARIRDVLLAAWS